MFAGVSAIVLNYASSYTMTLVLVCIVVSFSGLCISIVSGIAVEIFPTNLRWVRQWKTSSNRWEDCRFSSYRKKTLFIELLIFLRGRLEFSVHLNCSFQRNGSKFIIGLRSDRLNDGKPYFWFLYKHALRSSVLLFRRSFTSWVIRNLIKFFI